MDTLILPRILAAYDKVFVLDDVVAGYLTEEKMLYFIKDGEIVRELGYREDDFGGDGIIMIRDDIDIRYGISYIDGKGRGATIVKAGDGKIVYMQGSAIYHKGNLNTFSYSGASTVSNGKGKEVYTVLVDDDTDEDDTGDGYLYARYYINGEYARELNIKTTFSNSTYVEKLAIEEFESEVVAKIYGNWGGTRSIVRLLVKDKSGDWSIPDNLVEDKNMIEGDHIKHTYTRMEQIK